MTQQQNDNPPSIAPLAADANAGSTPDTGFLVFNGNTTDPAPIVVAWFSAVGTSGFGATQTGTFFSSGIKWKYPSTAPTLTFTFTLDTGIAQLTSTEITFSAVKGGQQTVEVPATAARYNFTVVTTSGKTHDPQIVVTPL
jgi:hypothetical protein